MSRPHPEDQVSTLPQDDRLGVSAASQDPRPAQTTGFLNRLIISEWHQYWRQTLVYNLVGNLVGHAYPLKRRDLIKQLEQAGCVMIRHGGKHDWYRNPTTGMSQPVPHHRDIDELLAKRILKQLTE